MECSSGPANIRNRMGSMGRRVAAAALLLAQVWSARGSSCREELTPETNSTGLGRCVAACINLAAAQPAQDEWSPGELGGRCAECAAELTQCKPRSVAAAGTDAGWIAESGTLDAEARDFTCGAQFRWSNVTRATADAPESSVALRLRLSDLCYPAACSDGDITQLIRDAEAVIATHTPDTVTVSTAEKVCDLLGSFVNEGFAWVLFAAALLLIAASCCMPKAKVVPYVALLWMLYIFTLIDILVGLGFIALAAILQAESDFPQYLVLSVVGVGAVHLVIAIVLWCGGLRKDGTPCVMNFARGLAYVLGPLGGVLGIIFQVFGDEMLVDTFSEVGVELSQEDRGEIQDFMQTTNTLLVCVFFIMMGVHTSTIPVSKSVRDYRYEKRDKKEEDTKIDQLREEHRYEKEKNAFTDKYRKKIAKENKKHPSPFASV
jgi:hypothetical protein